MLRFGERQPAVAPQAAVPADTLRVDREHLVLRAQLGGVGPDELVAPDAAHDQLPVKLRAEALGLDGAREVGVLHAERTVTGAPAAPAGRPRRGAPPSPATGVAPPGSRASAAVRCGRRG